MNARLNQQTNTKESTQDNNHDNQTTPITFNLQMTNTTKTKTKKINNIYTQITREELVKTVNLLIDKINILEEKLHTSDNTTKKPTKPRTEEKEYLPAINIDKNGEAEPSSAENQVQQPLDFTTVRTARKIRPDRPPIPEAASKQVSRDMKEHVRQQQQQKKNRQKTRRH